MRPSATEKVQSNVICLSICHDGEPCKKLNRDAIYEVDSWGHKETCIRQGQYPPTKRALRKGMCLANNIQGGPIKTIPPKHTFIF